MLLSFHAVSRPLARELQLCVSHTIHTFLGSESRAELEEMLRQGYSMQEVLDYFMKNGKTEEEERKAHFQKLQVN